MGLLLAHGDYYLPSRRLEEMEGGNSYTLFNDDVTVCYFLHNLPQTQGDDTVPLGMVYIYYGSPAGLQVQYNVGIARLVWI